MRSPLMPRDARRFYPFIRPYLFRAVLAILVTIPAGALDATAAWLLKPYMDTVMLAGGSTRAFSIFPLLIVVFALVQSLLNYAANYLNTWVGKKIASDLKTALFDRLTHSDAAVFDHSNSGDILQHFNSDADIASEGLLSNIKLFSTRLVSSLALIAVLIYNSWLLALVAVGALGIAVIPLTRVRQRMKRLVNESVQAGAAVTTHYNEAFAGNRVVAAYNLGDYLRARLGLTLKNIFHLNIKMTQRTSLLSLAMHFATAVGIAATVWLQGYLIISGAITPGNFVSFMAALLMLYTPIKNLGNNFNSVQASFMAITRVLDLLESRPSIVNRPGALAAPKKPSHICYQGVFFAYEPGKPVLQDINLEVEAGQTLAFVGDSGGGKTTLVNLLPRFYDLNAGSITVDGQDIRNLTLESLRQMIAIVFQDNFLFNGSIRENILLGHAGATPVELERAIQAACLDDFLGSLEKGLDTEIGERG
ncbi:MAG: ABC transporter ATP-binding protein/permease, partial [Planctomycetota bacterium]|nr:ABC transporter ATP-binding protein/permease [Planctomycetota bacterium]